MTQPRGDAFDRARSAASALLVAAAVAAVIGSLMDWVTIVERRVDPAADFGRPVEAGQGEPFTGVEARDGYYTTGAAIVMFAAAVMLFARATRGWAWVAFLCALVIGAIGIADYRALGDATTALSRRMGVGPEARPAAGLTLVVTAAFAGLIGAVLGLAATPSRR